MTVRRRAPGHRQLAGQADLFWTDPEAHLSQVLAGESWPAPERFPVNHAGGRVRAALWTDLISSTDPLLVAGFSSIASLVDLIADWARQPAARRARVVLGTEPFTTDRVSFGSRSAAFTEAVRRYWLEEQGVSLRLSAKLLQVIGALDNGRLQVRFVHGSMRLHAKVYVGDAAATVGSSNFTEAGLGGQIEANARFVRDTDAQRYADTVRIAENLWEVGSSWDSEFRDLLVALLRFVPWREALARACTDLLEGSWADRYRAGDASVARLWPSQTRGIAQALWIVETVGSVLVADATGSGKTRMGAYLARAVRDRLWSTGRARRDLTVLVCPPPVENRWLHEAVACGLTINTVSHGLLSRQSAHGTRAEELAVRQAQVLAVDECHNFLSPAAKRTRRIRESTADHVLLFTATPISRGATDLLQLVGLLGADNFDDETLEILDRLERRGRSRHELTGPERERLRREIQRFTVRRTKAALNALVDEDPQPYRHPDTGRVCRYPAHEPYLYDTLETSADSKLARTIRGHTGQLAGIAVLGRRIALPAGLGAEYGPQRWLEGRLAAARGLAGHHVLSAVRSSRAALIEHVAGTDEAVRHENIAARFKPTVTGNMLATVQGLLDAGPPSVDLHCELPRWLTDRAAWQAACAAEVDHYQAILDAARHLSDARDGAKAEVLAGLCDKHDRIIAFDRHLITLYVIAAHLDTPNHRVIIATGASGRRRREVEATFAPQAEGKAIALCSDAMNEGLNLQGASAIVHLDLPTTLRVAEQRVGRVDRMDSPHDAIAAWWPHDGDAFATRANELLAARTAESSALLGSNLILPDLGNDQRIVTVEEHIALTERVDSETWDGIHDAFDPVRHLIAGSDALLTAAEYRLHRDTTERVLSRISPLRSVTPWAFMAISGSAHGVPRWLVLEGESADPIIGLDNVVARLRHHLADDPPSRGYDDACDAWLNRYLAAAARWETLLLPRRMQRALKQMAALTATWAAAAAQAGQTDTAERWKELGTLAAPRGDESQPDAYLIAETWLSLVQPALDEARSHQKRSRYVRLGHIDAQLRRQPLPLDQAEIAFARHELRPPLARRISACILGIPDAGVS